MIDRSFSGDASSEFLTSNACRIIGLDEDSATPPDGRAAPASGWRLWPGIPEMTSTRHTGVGNGAKDGWPFLGLAARRSQMHGHGALHKDHRPSVHTRGIPIDEARKTKKVTTDHGWHPERRPRPRSWWGHGPARRARDT